MGYNFYDFGILFIWYKINYLEFLIKEKFLFLLKLRKNFDVDIWYLYVYLKKNMWVEVLYLIDLMLISSYLFYVWFIVFLFD